MTRSILFLSGTRADYGKIKPLIMAAMGAHDVKVIATGMHMMAQYGSTYLALVKDGLDVYPLMNQDADTQQDRILANTIHGLSLYVRETRPDMIVVHGDRVEALAGAIVGNLNGILTAHVEGGELSGTVDGMIRHSITKLAHVHFCANEEARQRLIRMGEDERSIYAIGSPDIDVMLSDNLPDIEEVLARYHIDWHDYGILIYHPVVGESPEQYINTILAAIESGINWVAIYPNNDPGGQRIIDLLDKTAQTNQCLHVIPSMRFEYFLTLLKHARVIAGNSSAGIREAPVYGVPSIDIGTRQSGRARLDSIRHVGDNYNDIARAMKDVPAHYPPSLEFGRGDSAVQFTRVLSGAEFWDTPIQKVFYDP